MQPWSLVQFLDPKRKSSPFGLGHFDSSLFAKAVVTFCSSLRDLGTQCTYIFEYGTISKMNLENNVNNIAISKMNPKMTCNRNVQKKRNNLIRIVSSKGNLVNLLVMINYKLRVLDIPGRCILHCLQG